MLLNMLRCRSAPTHPARRPCWQPRLEQLEPRLTPTEIGVNDFRISNMGPDGNANFDAFNPAVAYNTVHNQYLVVWEGEETTDNESEIHGQLLDAATGNPSGPISASLTWGPTAAPASTRSLRLLLTNAPTTSTSSSGRATTRPRGSSKSSGKD
jgi:hypothetical protein